MNYDDELRFARQQHAKLHGAGLGGTRADAELAKGWAVGRDRDEMVQPQFKMQYNQSMQIGAVSAESVSDAELLIRLLDKATADLRDLSQNSYDKLQQFAAPMPAAGDNMAKHAYACNSSYFQILESRVEMIQEQISALRQLVNSVSASPQKPLTADTYK